MPSEAQARITINKLLEDAAWRFLPDAQGRCENIVCEHRVTKSVFSPSQDLGRDFEHAPNGFVDYVLLKALSPYRERNAHSVPCRSAGAGKPGMEKL